MYSPEGIFPLGITHSSRPAAKLNKKVFRPERTVCVQSRKRFFTPEQPIHPGLSRNFGRSGRISGLGYQKMTHDVLLCTVTRLFCYPKPLLHPGLSRNCGEATTRRSRNYVSGPGTQAEKEKQKESNKKILSAFLRLFFSEMLFAESTLRHLVEMAKL